MRCTGACRRWPADGRRLLLLQLQLLLLLLLLWGVWPLLLLLLGLPGGTADGGECRRCAEWEGRGECRGEWAEAEAVQEQHASW